ncbi:MAG: aryl-sulfate sulfotransferase, partial [Chitinophagales bacterium]
MKHLLFTVFTFFLFIQALSAQFVFVAPVPGSKYHHPDRTIILRAASKLKPDSYGGDNWYVVTGSLSGKHLMNVSIADDQKTLLLKPIKSFSQGESVNVTINNSLITMEGTHLEGYQFSFVIQPHYSIKESMQLEAAAKKVMSDDFGTTRNNPAIVRDSETFPKFTIDVNKEPSPGDIFYYTFNFQGSPNKFISIMTSDGDSVFAQQTIAKGSTFDINKNGYLTVFNYDSAYFEVWDSSYNVINTYTAANGYATDPHDFILLPNGHSFIIADDPQIVDMTVYSPNYHSDASVIGAILQELDSNKNLVFEWRSWDHIDIMDAKHIYFSTQIIDYVHPNSIEVDDDGNILMSCRMLDQILKINSSTGDLIWRMGGGKNEFAFTNDPVQFNFQHDCRRLKNGHLTVFDNGCYHSPPVATFKEYEVDEINKTAKLVFSYQHPLINGKNLQSWAMGNAQRLSNGNTFINWGYIIPGTGSPNMTEIDSIGNIVWEMHFNDTIDFVTYRAHRYEWTPCILIAPDSLTVSQVSETAADIHWKEVKNAGS